MGSVAEARLPMTAPAPGASRSVPAPAAAAGAGASGRGVPAAEAVMARASGENFPVASFFLPAPSRRHLLSIYGFARLVDELGDSVEGDRLEALDWLQSELEAAFEGGAKHPIMRRLQSTIAECDLDAAPLERLIEANRVDQSVHRYETWEQLEGYCDLSANPVGELVLAVFGLASPARVALSDRICTALQLIEHCQDVAEDLRAGRIYLPRQDMERCGCTEEDLAAPEANAAVRSVIELEMGRSASLLAEGAPLLGTLTGRPRLAVAAFLAGGEAAIGAVRAAGCDVLKGAPTAGTGRRLLALAKVLARGAGAGGAGASGASCDRVGGVSGGPSLDRVGGVPGGSPSGVPGGVPGGSSSGVPGGSSKGGGR